MRLMRHFCSLIHPFRRFSSGLVGKPVSLGGYPNGLFSEVESIEKNEVYGAVALNCQKLNSIPKDSEIFAAGLRQAEYSNWQTVWTKRDNCLLLSPSLAHIDNNKVCIEAIYGPHKNTDPVWRHQSNSMFRNLSGDFTSIVSRWNQGDNYYHWFMDGLTRLYHLDTFPTDCRILVPRDLPSYAQHSLKILGLNHRIEETSGEDLQIERYWFAGPTMLTGCPDPAGTSWIRNRILPKKIQVPEKLLYVERTAGTRSCSNSLELRQFFANRGWDIVDPGTLPLDQQIDLFASARLVVGVHGAALTNLLWMSPGARVLELMPSKRRNGCYASLAHVIGLHHETMVVNSDRHGKMSIPLGKLEQRVQRIERIL